MAEVIIYVPCFDRSAPRFLINYGALSIATALKNHCVDVKYIDGSSGSLPEVCELIRTELKDCVYFGVSAFTAQVKEALLVSEFVKSCRPELPIVWGGIHASILADETALDQAVDYVCAGEGDYTAIELYEQLKSGHPDLTKVHNLVYRTRTGLAHTDIAPFFDMATLENFAWDLLDLERYVIRNAFDGSGVPSLGIPIARGCPHRCSFCINSALKQYGYTNYRRRIPDHVENDIAFLKKRLGLGFSYIRDEVFFVDTEYSREIAKRFHRHGIAWGSNVRANYFTSRRLNESYLSEMRDLGMIYGCVGVESGSPRVLRDIIQKDTTLEQIFHAMEVMKKAGIRPFMSFVVGFPTETPAETRQTIDLARKLKKLVPNSVVAGIYLLRPYPGAPVYDLCLKHGFKAPQSLREWGQVKLTDQGSLDTSFLPWLDKRRNLYEVVEYAGLSLIDIEKGLGLNTIVHVLLAKMRVRLGFYGLPFERWISKLLKKIKSVVKRIKKLIRG
jgi:anaerobic magnesium-protoporphyrin IX monomethyl ester cyclase